MANIDEKTQSGVRLQILAFYERIAHITQKTHSIARISYIAKKRRSGSYNDVLRNIARWTTYEQK